jgi:hypothetical protein
VAKTNFPEIEPYQRAQIEELGYLPLHLSVFDHWLTREECEGCDLINYETALSAAKIVEYQAGEDKFIDFYRRLIGADEVSVNEDDPVYRAHSETLFNAIIVPSLRERKLMDLFVERANVRIVGGYDRTDLLLAREEAQRQALRQLARDVDLFLLD